MNMLSCSGKINTMQQCMYHVLCYVCMYVVGVVVTVCVYLHWYVPYIAFCLR